MKSKLTWFLALYLAMMLTACVVVPARPVYVDVPAVVVPPPVVFYGHWHHGHRW